MLETIVISGFLGFIGSRLGVMAFDFMCYKEIFWFIKKYVLRKIIGSDLHDTILMNAGESKNDVSFLIQDKCGIAENRNGTWPFVLRLINCKFCLTIWTSIVVAIMSILFYNVGIESILFVPIFGYLITEKL